MERCSQTRWGTIALITVAGVAATFQIGKMPASLPSIRQDLGIGLVTASWIVAMVSLVGGTTGVVFGAIADRFGHRRVLLLSLSCMSVASLAGAFASSSAEILITRFVEGAGLILIYTAAPVIVVSMSGPNHRRLVLGIWSVFMPAGIGLMILLTPIMLGLVGWRGIWIANAVILASIALVVPMIVGRERRTQSKARSTNLSILLGDIAATVVSKGAILVTICFMAFALSMFSILAFLPTFLIEENGFDIGWATILTAGSILACVPSVIVSGMMMQAGIERWVICAVAQVLMALAGIAFFLMDASFAAHYGACLAFFFFAGLIPPAIFASAQYHATAEHRVAATTGLFVQGTSLGQLVGPPILAIAVATWSWDTVPWMIAVVGGIGFASACLFRMAEIDRVRNGLAMRRAPAPGRIGGAP